MIDILSHRGARAIQEFANSHSLLVFDLDGTLAPIVEDRRTAHLRERTRELLVETCTRYACAVVSGRDRVDVLERVAGVPLVAVVGNHGAELDHRGADPVGAARVRGWAAMLGEALAGEPGIEIEEKELTIAIHHRRAATGREVHRRILDAASRLRGARVFGGRAVVNVAPVGASDKGRAIEVLARQLGAERVAFVGDDVTDEDGFRSPAVTLAVRVGPSRRTAARYLLRRQEDIEALLEAFVRARPDGEVMAVEHRKAAAMPGKEA